MGFKAFRGSAFNHSHENQAFNTLYDKLQAEWQDRDEELYLFGNFFVAGKEFDALIVKNNAMIVIDFKNFGGDVTFSENGPWKCDDIIVKGGNSRNPFLQLRNNKFALLDYVKSGHIELLSRPNLGHIAGLVIFHQPIQFDESQVPQQIKSWFHICDLDKALRTIDSIASAEIDLSNRDLALIVEAFDAPEYFPDGKPVTKKISLNEDDKSDIDFSPLGSQKKALDAANSWISSTNSALILKGMSSTGKRTLLSEILNLISAKNLSPLLIAPNARLAKKYTEMVGGEFTSIYQTLYSNKSDGVIKKSNGVELAKHHVILTNEEVKDKVIVIVESHLISNSYYDMDTTIFGTGHMVNDLLSVFGETPPKLLLVGDPYQLSRGNLDQCLLSAHAINDKGIDLVEVFLEQQIESDPKELHDFQFDIAQQMQLKQFNQLPLANNDVVCELDNSPDIGKEITMGRYQGVYLTALNDVAHKINMAAKSKVLQQANPYSLCIGDLVDFHTSSPAINESPEGIENSIDWVHSGEIMCVTGVSDHVEVIELLLKGRDVATSVRIGEFTCNVPSVGDVRLKYLIDYLHAEKPELNQDQMLVLSIVARQQAEEKFKDLKTKVKQLKEGKHPDYDAENKKYRELVQNQIAYSPLLNAARIRYAYSMTVHRAQGRNWNNVFLDASRGSSGDAITNDAYFRFLYTASMCTNIKLNLLKYPKLTPLYKCQFIPNSNCKVAPFTIAKGFNYSITEGQELETFMPPVGFDSEVIELKYLCFEVSRKVQNTAWRISEIKQHSYQEMYTFEHDSGAKQRVRFTYDKNIKVKTLVYPDESNEPELCNELKALLNTSPKLNEPRLIKAMEAIEEFYSSTDFNILTAKERSEWEMLIGLSDGNDSIELKFWVDKAGLATKVMPERASTQDVMDLMKGALNE